MVSRDDLLYFFEVSRTLNFSRAAERVGISQPSLSAGIKRLEKAIGADVFLRHQKGVCLTKSGRELLLHTKQLLQYWETVQRKTLAASKEPEGYFTIGSHPSIALAYFSKFLPELLKKHPKLEIELKLALSRQIVSSVLDLSIDVGIVANPVKHPSLVIQKLRPDRIAFFQSAQYNETADLFSGKAIIICDLELIQTQWLLKKLVKKNISYASIMNINNLEVILELTATGCGVGILPLCRAQTKENLVLVPNVESYYDDICLIYRPENRDIVGIQKIISEIKKALIL